MSAVRLVLYTGKGGVGKTTTAAATAVAAARSGRRTLVVSADAAHSLGDVLEHPLGPAPTRLEVPHVGDLAVVGHAPPATLGDAPRASVGDAPRAAVAYDPPATVGGQTQTATLHAVEVDGRAEMARHWGRIRDYLVSLFRYQGIEEVVAEELALLPGAEELTALLAVEDHLRSREFDCVVVDCAPTDTTLRMVSLPEVAHGALRLLLKLQQALSSVVTPLARGVVPVPLPESAVFRDAEELLYRKLRRVHRRLGSAQASVRIVLTPERMVIDEGRRAFTDLCLFGIPCDAVVMNRMLPSAAADEAFFSEWVRLQDERRREVEQLFAPLRVLEAPLQEDEVTGLQSLAAHGRDLFGELDPCAVLTQSPRIRFARHQGAYQARLPLPGARASDLDVAKVEDELVVRAGERRRALKLPRRIVPLDLESARLEEGELVVSFSAQSEAAPRPGGEPGSGA